MTTTEAVAAAAPTVVLVLRAARAYSSGAYGTEHVKRLLPQIEHHWPYTVMSLRCVVLTDTPIGAGIEERPLGEKAGAGWWSKLELCNPRHADLGDMLYFDLDTCVVGDLLGVAAVRRLTMLRDFYRPDALGSGLMYLPAILRPLVWGAWWPSAPTPPRHYRGDQEFLAATWKRHGVPVACWQDLVPPGQIVSYKVHIRPNGGVVPLETRCVCYHGHPRPWEAPPLISAQ